MKTRTYKELYAILLKALENGRGMTGICGLIVSLYQKDEINSLECAKLDKHLSKNKPTARNKFKSFYEDPLFNRDSAYWWNWMLSTEYRAVRISFIKAILSTL